MVPLGAARDEVDVDVVTAIGRAVAERRMQVDYTRHDGEEVPRVLEPHRIVHTAGRWYLVALDAERVVWRTLRVDRMRRPLVLREEFAERDIPDEALPRLASRSIATAPCAHRARVRIHAPAAEVSRAFDPTVATVAADGDATSILTAGANRPEEFATYLGMARFEFEVIDGETVRLALVHVGQRLLRAARAS
jgi:predicted DNA-binding transcriptional regulator YafY